MNPRILPSRLLCEYLIRHARDKRACVLVKEDGHFLERAVGLEVGAFLEYSERHAETGGDAWFFRVVVSLLLDLESRQPDVFQMCQEV